MGPCNKSNAAFDDPWALTLIKCFIFYSVCVCVWVRVCGFVCVRTHTKMYKEH